jgi:hypothetical protein
MAQLNPAPVRFIFIYRGDILYKGELRRVRFDSWVRRVDPHQYYQCIDLVNYNVYEALGSSIMDYALYNMRPLTKTDPKYITELPLQQN